ncbi:hypothetical protein Bca52824_041027 [Brassica carinata]|uniref:Uncharacterized protein n=1 Tax=Brassica carinata TaxID=52824 RepID=A0A8X7RUJ0_BRACI|nr:hypothetical protein Bca52824_041027 [Brassica carinata]
MAASSTLLARLKAGRCFNTVEVWLLRFWEARNDRFAINSKSMEGSLVLALMLDEASSPVSRALDGRQTYIFLVDGGLRRRSPAYVQLLHFQKMGQEHEQGPESFRYEGINRWENMDGLENSTVTSVENYTVMKWHVDCLHYTRVPFNYHI